MQSLYDLFLRVLEILGLLSIFIEIAILKASHIRELIKLTR